MGSSIFCGCGSNAGNSTTQQFVVYQRPISKNGGNFSDRNLSQQELDAGAQGCGLGSALQGGHLRQVHCAFKDFSELLTFKLLRQIKLMEAHTVVEASTQNVSCVFWPSSMRQAVPDEQEPHSYELQEFRQSIALQKA